MRSIDLVDSRDVFGKVDTNHGFRLRSEVIFVKNIDWRRRQKLLNKLSLQLKLSTILRLSVMVSLNNFDRLVFGVFFLLIVPLEIENVPVLRLARARFHAKFPGHGFGDMGR